MKDQKSHSPEPDDQLSDEDETYVPQKGLRRYEKSLKTLIPIRTMKNDSNTMAVDNSGLFSVIGFSWLSDVIYKAYRKGITIADLPSVCSSDACASSASRLDLMWKEELALKGAEKASFAAASWRFCRTRIYASWIILICSLTFGFGSTVLMQRLLEHVQLKGKSHAEGWKWAVLLSLAELMRILFLAWTWALNYRTALRLRSACLGMVYRKIIFLNNLGNKGIGEVVNVFSNDAQRIFDVTHIAPLIVGGPIITTWGIFYIYWLLGPMALLGMIVFLMFYPIMYKVSQLIGYFQAKFVKACDMRVRLINEILDCIKLIKMYAWEKRFSQDVLNVRKREIRFLSLCQGCYNLNICLAPAIPVISAITTFLAHLSVGNSLTAAQAFPYTSLLDGQLRLSLYFLQDSLEFLVAARISFKRFKSLLLLEDGSIAVSKPILKSQAIAISHGTFAWDIFENEKDESSREDKEKRKTEQSITKEKYEKEELNMLKNSVESIEVLFDISFEVTKGKLIGICGNVGSGKSSLLLAALGQLRVTEGQVMRDGSCAYVSQEAWITNATLRENILFGTPFDQDRYDKTIYASNLAQDIDMMPAGDQTEIGEKGVNLSGGQKQRVALARALYADRDIYFLDDPLSAVDSRVGSHIFENFILGALKGKTTLFVTHQIQYLNRCDDIYLLREGRIIEHGTHDELMKLDNEYATMVATFSKKGIPEKQSLEEDKNIQSPLQLEKKVLIHKESRIHPISIASCDSVASIEKLTDIDANIIVADKLQQGSIKLSTYHSYIKSMGGYFFTIIVIFSFFLNVGSTAFSSWWLALWIKAGSGNTTIVRNNETVISESINDNPDFGYYQIIYASSIGIILVTSVFRTAIYTKAVTKASINLHNKLFKTIMSCPMRFFDTTPRGRIQHLFSRDMDEVDTWLPITLTSILQDVFALIFAMLVICVVLPWFMLPLLVLLVIYYFVSSVFRVGIRDLKRMDNMSRAPILGYVTATVQGLRTIHAFGKESEFSKKFYRMFDENSKCLFLYNGAMRWLAVRVDLLSIMITCSTAFLVVMLQEQVSPALAGLALAYSVQISDVLQYTTRLVTEIDVRFISVERIAHYVKTLKSEGSSHQVTVKPQSDWPSAARIKFNNVSMAYGDGGPHILKDVSFTVEAGEKIGIVGRTGAGKSSLTIALFRLAELVEGSIEIDDVNISEVGLDHLRAKLSIIPQDPLLFSGTIRSNLDPFNLYSDAEIWQALDKTKLKGRVESMTGQLEATVNFGGDNFSVGERQLLCLSRALLRNSKILVLDEATATVDPETEKAVQNTVQREFCNCTILTIAHRLQTVLSLDRILVMDGGKVFEFDTPENLLKDKNSEFSKMMAAAEKSGNQ